MVERLSRRGWLRLAVGTAVAWLSVGCRATVSGAPGSAPPAPTAPADAALTLTVANSELVVGRNRFGLAVLEHNRPVADARVTLELFQLDGQRAIKRSQSDAVYRTLDGVRGIYVAQVMFDQPGPWGVQAIVARTGQPTLTARSSFQVVEHTSTPTPGMRAVSSRSPTARDVADLGQICSAQPHCDMHEVSIADALGLDRPAVIAFATPGYCTSQMCAPVLGEVQKVKARAGQRASFIHIEIYKDPRNLVVADTVQEWGLQSEPWVFIVDRQGVITERFESITTAEEIAAALGSVAPVAAGRA